MNQHEPPRESERFPVGPFHVDLESRTVTRDDGPSGLSLRAEELLLLLCRFQGQVVTRQQILDVVWKDRVVEDAVIHGCIWQIRRALGETERDLLQTHAKRGYRLNPSGHARNAAAVSARSSETVQTAPDPGHDMTDDSGAHEIGLSRNNAHLERPKTSILHRLRRMPHPLMLVLAAVVFFIWPSERTAFEIPEDPQISVAVLATGEQEAWLRTAVLRTVAEQAHLRGARIVAFQRAQTSDPFSAPHLQIELLTRLRDEIVVDMLLSDTKKTFRQNYRGAPEGLTQALTLFIEAQFGKADTSPNFASAMYAAGAAAEAEFDHALALLNYRKALAHAPDLGAAHAGIIRILYLKGRFREVESAIEAAPLNALTPWQRCEMDVIALEILAHAVSERPCPRATRLAKIMASDLDVIARDAAASTVGYRSPEDWLSERIAAVYAHTRLNQWAQASLLLDRAQRVARNAGWEHAVLELESYRAILATYRGQREESSRIRLRVAHGFQALGDQDRALYQRTYGFRLLQLPLGEATTRHRAALAENLALASRIGNRRAEIDLLELSTRIAPPASDAWRSLEARRRALILDSYTAQRRITEEHMMLAEWQYRHLHGEVLDAIVKLQAQGATDPLSQAWNLSLKTKSLMALDRLEEAVAVVEDMDRQKFDLASIGGACRYAWLLVEAGKPLRAQELLRSCQGLHRYDRTGAAGEGDLGLLASARLQQRYGDAAEAWPTLRGRIEALLVTKDPTLGELTSLTVLARHAVDMPGADRTRLRQAADLAARSARLDGADATLLLGTHLLEWRLCRADKRTDCGPLLPAYAQQERFEARLALATPRP